MTFGRALGAAIAGLLVTASAAGCGSSSAKSATTPSATCKPAHTGVQTLSKGSLSVLVYVSPPYTTQTGSTFGGVDGTIVKKLAEMECLKLKETSTAPAALIASLQSKRGDLGIGGIYYTAQRAQTLNLSDPMYRDGMALLSRSALSGSIQSLKGKSVGVIQGYLWDADFQKALGSGNVKVYQDSAGMITDLKDGRLDAAVLTSAEAAYRAKQDPALKVTQFQSTPEVSASLKKDNVVLAIVKDETSLTSAFNADITTLLNDGFIARVLSDNGMDPSLAGGAHS